MPIGAKASEGAARISEHAKEAARGVVGSGLDPAGVQQHAAVH